MSLIGFSPSFPNQASVKKALLMIPISRWFPDSPLKLPFSLVLALKQAFFFFGGGGYVYVFWFNCSICWTSAFWEIDFLLYAIVFFFFAFKLSWLHVFWELLCREATHAHSVLTQFTLRMRSVCPQIMSCFIDVERLTIISKSITWNHRSVSMTFNHSFISTWILMSVIEFLCLTNIVLLFIIFLRSFLCRPWLFPFLNLII